MQQWISSSLFLVESLKLFIKFFLDFEINIIVGLVSNFINFFGLVRVKVRSFTFISKEFRVVFIIIIVFHSILNPLFNFFIRIRIIRDFKVVKQFFLGFDPEKGQGAVPGKALQGI
jgi:hypothetical protein